MLEENKKYLKNHRKDQNLSRLKGDINLDLVKQESQTKSEPFMQTSVSNGQRFWFKNDDPLWNEMI